MKQTIFYFAFLIGVIAFGSCKKSLNLAVTSTNANILVVEGLINIGADSTKIKLSRTVVVGNKTIANPETKATVTIENAQATVATLKEVVTGTYAVPGLNLDKTKQYRVRIKTINNKIYVSDLVDAKVTPPIDSVGYKINADGIQVYANTHDDTNNSRYYLYSYDEAWKFVAKYKSLYVTNGTDLVFRSAAQDIYECFGSASSPRVLINSTAALSKDVSYQFPLITIDATAERISIRYGMKVTQITITKEAYVFWDNLKKNTEQLGSIFDAQPTQLIGNIHNVANASEPVIGYISAATTQTKLIFIDRSELPQTWKTTYPYGCVVDSIPLIIPGTNNMPVRTYLVPLNTSYITLVDYPSGASTVGYLATSAQCADCTIRGRKKQPIFWK